MKYCPTCETRYDEEVLRFCMKDGTPLLEEAEPNFTEMPSENLEVADVEADDPSEVTVIRRNIPVPPMPQQEIDDDFSDVRPNSGGQRIVVPTFEDQQRERSRVAAQYQSQQPRRTNTALVVFLTMVFTALVLGFGGTLFYFLVVNRDDNENSNLNANVNANQNVNVNTNLGANSIFDFNTNGGTNSATNVNVNTNARTPTPTPTHTATPRPVESPEPTPDEDVDPTPLPSRTPVPMPTPIIIRPGSSPVPGRTPTRTPAPTPRTIITPTNRPN